MKCPECYKNMPVDEHEQGDGQDYDPITEFMSEWQTGDRTPGVGVFQYVGNNRESHWWLETFVCPACHTFIVAMASNNESKEHPPMGVEIAPPEDIQQARVVIWPRHSGRRPVPLDVPEEFAQDYREACLTLESSPNASAALSRRCLELILTKHLQAPSEVTNRNGKMRRTTLWDKIMWSRENGKLPSAVIDVLDVPQKVGNRGAHPTIADDERIIVVEPWEAKWSLLVIEALYEHLFVIPAKYEKMREEFRAAYSAN